MHTTTLRVRPYECDVYGHVNNAVYLNYLEVARDTLLLDSQLNYAELVTSGLGIWVSEAHLFYRSPARLGETLTIESTPDDLGASSVQLKQLVLGERRRVIAEAKVRLVWVNALGRPTRIPPTWREAFVKSV